MLHVINGNTLHTAVLCFFNLMRTSEAKPVLLSGHNLVTLDPQAGQHH